MDWLYYLLEANLYLLIFYGFYRLLLHNETFYTNNRYYLLISSVTAFLLPILQLGFLNPTQAVDNAAFPMPVLYTAEQLAKIAAKAGTAQTNIDYTTYLYPIYLCISFCFAIKLGLSLYKIIHLWFTAKKDNKGTITIIELAGEKAAFSFFNLLFIHPKLAEKQTVLKHEMVHIKQKHSLDILFFEVLQIICWFNPMVYFIKKDIKLLHEYIADELSADTSLQKHEYAMFLIENSFGVVPNQLTNQIFNQSILKRRINMLNKKRTAGRARLRLLLALPLVGGMLCTSTMAFTKDYGYIDLLPEKSNAVAPTQEIPKVEQPKKNSAQKPLTVKKDQVKFPPPTVKKDQIKFPPPIVKPDVQTRYIVRYGKDKTGNQVRMDKRYVIVNGSPVADQEKFYGAANTESIIFLNQQEASKKYGAENGRFGAVEITGSNIIYADQISPIPPKVDVVKFPPPVVREDRKNPPVVEPPPPHFKTKKDQVKFPPPVIKEDRKTPPAVEPPPPHFKTKKDQVKFPPPVIKEDRKTPPAVEPPPPHFKAKKDQVKFPPPVIKEDIKSPATVIKSDQSENTSEQKTNLKLKEEIVSEQKKLNIKPKERNPAKVKLNEVNGNLMKATNYLEETIEKMNPNDKRIKPSKKVLAFLQSKTAKTLDKS